MKKEKRMSAKDSANETLPSTGVPELLNATTELALLSSEPTEQNLDSLPIIVALICIFLLLTIGLLFVTLCKPAALDPSFHRPHECMPYHFEDANEPQLKLWKRLGSLRQSLCSVKRTQPVSRGRETWPRKGPVNQDWSVVESTAM